MSNMEAMRSEQNSLGLLEAPSHNLSGDTNSRREMSATPAQDVYEIRPRKDGDGFDLTSDRLRNGSISSCGTSRCPWRRALHLRRPDHA